jgi:hypothetical protein
MTPTAPATKLFELWIDRDLGLHVSLAGSLVVGLVAIVVVLCLLQLWRRFQWFKTLEIDQAEIGVGQNKIKLSPNEVDRQIAYKIWVELSTRKIGLPIDLDHDVIAEVYDSWHTFFTVTRELIKDVPVAKFRRKDTEKIVSLSIEVLNHGLRPHLTQWQARFRRWYEGRMSAAGMEDKSPQEIQRTYPEFAGLSEDLLAVNNRLMLYRVKMLQIVVSP